MEKVFESTLNTRAILPDSYRYIRSDVPSLITEKEIEWLIAHNVTTIIDLRTEGERNKKECPLAYNHHFKYYCMPVTGGNAVPQTVNEVAKSYINMMDEQMFTIIDRIWSAKSNVLYFCNAGKDRTGVVSAVLLYKAGMSMEYIIDDYMKSKKNLQSMLKSYAKRFPDVDIDIITPHEKYIQEFLEWFIDKRGKM